MARSGGEADKLGNRYEALWTVDSLLAVLSGEAQGIVVEPIDAALGVEFVLRLNDDAKEYHSLKRQTTQSIWSLPQLTATNANGRSILGDLFGKLMADCTHRAAFVSHTTANHLEELREIAEVSTDSSDFEKRLAAQSRVQINFQKYLLPLTVRASAAWEALRRLRVVGFTEPELTLRVDQRIRFTLYRPDGMLVEPEAVRLALTNAVSGWLGREIDSQMICDYLAERGWRQWDCKRDSTLHGRVAIRNKAYTEAVEAELIHGTAIPRKEAAEAVRVLTEGRQDVAIIGTAGRGKSCVVAQVIGGLISKSVPHLALRLDIQTSVLTSDALGRELDLPTSPAVTLARLAQGGRCVLVIDQLDALSLVSGRNQHLWTVFEELLTESRRYPEMRVLLACREFDAANDHRLKRLLADEKRCKKLTIDTLSAKQVAEAVKKAGVDPAKLSAHDVLLLQTPQNLSLFLQSGPQEHGQVGSVQALLNRYWDYKRRQVERRLGRPVQWLEVMKTLANWLSDHQTLSAPLDVLDAFMADAQAMASEHVLVLDGKSCRFFHESVFDYVFARIFVAQGGSATKLLIGDAQHLFRRGQVRQILTYNRDRSFDDYLADLGHLLTDGAIRTHIKKLVIDWLRSLPDPKLKEWRLLQSCASITPVVNWWRTVPHGSIGWFDVLNEADQWAAWLRSADDGMVRQALWLLGQEPIMRERSEKVMELIEPLLDGSPRWLERLQTLLRFCEPHHSRRMFDLFLRGVREGWLDDSSDHWWHHLHDFPDKAPSAAVELLEVFIERQFQRRPTGDPFPARASELHFPGDYCLRLAQAAPEAFLTQILPQVAAEITRRPNPKDQTHDEIWPYKSLGEIHDFGESLLEGLARAAENLAREQPERFRAVTMDFLSPVSHTLGFILLRGWIANPAALADDCARYLSHDHSRLRIGYDFAAVGGGHGPSYLSRRALREIGPHCTIETYTQMESALLGFRNKYESPQHRGYAQFSLLGSLPPERLGAATRSRFDELQRKFPEVSPSDSTPPKSLRMEFVPSPIAPEAMSNMSTKNWISAMRTYDSNRMRDKRGFLKGGMHELGRTLKHQVQKDRPRYARMMLDLPDDINPVYFDDILQGLVSDEADEGTAKQIFPPLDMESLTLTLRKANGLPGRPCARAISHVISRSAGRAIPDELLAMVSDYAINDPDPVKEDWLPPGGGGTPLWGGDPLFSGMNSGRGAAAWAIGSVLFENPSTWPKQETAVRALVSDKSIAVRSCVVRCLLALLNVDRALAVDLFLQLVEGADPVLGTGEVDNFIHHGMYPHYPKLRPLLLRMLQHVDHEAREAAAQQITVAAFDPSYGTADLEQALASGPECRAACAGVYAFNLREPAVRAACRERLKELFNDPEKKVRAEAATCFRGLEGDVLASEVELLGAYIQSTAFVDGSDQLMFALDESNALLPDVLYAIPERLLKLQAEPGSLRQPHCYHLPELVLRLYRQTNDPTVKNRCLDTIDQMLEFGISDIDTELGKVER